MMINLKKRSSAVLIAAIVIILGTLFGVHRSVNSETAKIEAQFYDGVYLKTEKYTQPSISSQLDKRVDAALGLVTIANKYGDLSGVTDDLRQARQEILGADSIAAKFSANEKMQTAYQKLSAALDQMSLSTNEMAAASQYRGTLDGAQGVIQKSAYNSLVSDYRNSALGAFPVNILKNLAFVKYPEYFGMEG